jgi:tripartite-type tricarboxylate transporter receptor subunit TctC
MKPRALLVGIAIGLSPWLVHSQGYPSKPVRLIVTYPAGGSADTLARFLGQNLSDTWGQQLVVDNRPGANGIVGTEAAAKSPPDGYTLYLATDGPISINPSLYTLPYDWKRDFAPVTLLAVLNQVMVVPASLPAQSVQELIALAKKNPGKLNYASIGIGSSPHLGAELFKSLAGVDMTHIPYKGAGQTITALLTGEAQMLFTSEQTAAPQVKAGKLRALATTARKRSLVFPDVPTVAESGLPDYEMRIWFALFAPAGTPESLIRKLNADFTAALRSQRDALVARGYDPQASTPEELRALVQDDQDRWAALVRKAGIKAQ